MGGRMKLMLVLFCFAISISSSIMVNGYRRGEGGRGEESGETFMLERSEQVVKTEAGEIRVVKGWNKGQGRQGIMGDYHQNAMHIGFISMEPKSMFIPQYLDSSLIMFVRRGEAKIGWIYKDGLVERKLRMGDVYRIPAGSAFYMVNTGKGQRLQIICSIDPSESLGHGVFQSFFIGGGTNPSSILAGFDHRTLTTAFNVSVTELEDIMTSQRGGPIIYIEGGRAPSRMASLMQLKQQERLKQMGQDEEDEHEQDEEEETTEWSWRKLLSSVFIGSNRDWKGGKRKTTTGGPDSYNIYDRKPDFRNNYGWSVALDKHDYSPLKHSGVGVYLVNLTAGSMMAPHVNPTATEYGIVLRGAGSIQVVYPNGSLAMNRRVEEGDVFWVPRYFPFCQIASRSGPMEFFGFTTSARKNRPQFLVGASSILQTMSGPELAMSFDVTEERLRSLINAQRESIILPSAIVSEPDQLNEDEVKKEREDSVIKNIGSEMIMGFD